MRSDLTRKEHWEGIYAEEIRNYDENVDGEDWYAAQCGQIASFLTSRFAKDTPVLDIGCGNGMFLKRLQNMGFTQLAGFDYVADAVRLARRLLGPSAIIDQLDLTAPLQNMPESSSRVSQLIADKWAAVIHDKGTFDLFFMSNRVAEYAAALQESYLGPGVHVLITSCNATVEELHEACSFMTSVAVLDLPMFTFGGVKGQVVSTVLFKRTAPQCWMVECTKDI